MIIEKDRHLKTEHPPTMLEAEALIKEIEVLMHDTQLAEDLSRATLVRIHRVLCEMRMHILDKEE